MEIFISSTYRDLKHIRESIHRSLSKAESLYSQGMEFFSASPESSKEVCLSKLRKSDLVLLIIGDEYGSIDAETDLSYTHLEFREAVKCNIPILAFLQEDTDKNLPKRIKRFQKEVVTGKRTVGWFSSKQELLGLIWPALFNHFCNEGFIKRDSITFQQFDDYYSGYLREEAAFNLCQTFVGRKDKLQHLNDFLAGKERICIVSGVGGIGKTKLMYEFTKLAKSKSNGYAFRFLCDQVSQNAEDGQEAHSQDCGKGVETKEEGVVRVLCLKNQQTTQSCPG